MDITWFRVADWAETHLCDTHRATGSCHHPGCHKTVAIRDNLMARGMGDILPNALTLQEIAKWAARKSCPNQRATGICNHRWCNESAPFIEWLNRQAATKKAA